MHGTDIDICEGQAAIEFRSYYDGNPDTRWCAANDSLPAWWRVALENFYTVEEVRIVFEQAGNYRYRIEVSEDDANWTVAVDRSAAADTEQERVDKFLKPFRARFLRIVYTGIPNNCWPSHRELEVKGTTPKP